MKSDVGHRSMSLLPSMARVTDVAWYIHVCTVCVGLAGFRPLIERGTLIAKGLIDGGQARGK